jgi:REP element-mobilizing transposase RayT
MRLNEVGLMIQTCWEGLSDRFPGIRLDAFVVMPNHMHGLILIDSVGFGLQPSAASAMRLPSDSQQSTLGRVVGAFKSITTHEYILGVRQGRWPPFRQRLWQRNYYEHVVRNDLDLNQIRDYIATNPIRWELDPENPHQTNGRGSIL